MSGRDVGRNGGDDPQKEPFFLPAPHSRPDSLCIMNVTPHREEELIDIPQREGGFAMRVFSKDEKRKIGQKTETGRNEGGGSGKK